MTRNQVILFPSAPASTAMPRPDAVLMRALARPHLTERLARAHAGRTEILFSTPAGRFCLHATPGDGVGPMASAWSYGILYAFDGKRGEIKPVWQMIKGAWVTAMFDDSVWTGTSAELAEEAADASMAHRFLLPATARPTPRRTDAP